MVEGIVLGEELGLHNQVAISTRESIIWQGFRNWHNTGPASSLRLVFLYFLYMIAANTLPMIWIETITQHFLYMQAIKMYSACFC